MNSSQVGKFIKRELRKC